MLPIIVRTFAPKGTTPLFRHVASWKNLSSISGITLKAKLYIMVQEGSIKSEQVTRFLSHLLYHIKGKICILWDRSPTHRSKRVQDFIQKHSRIWQEFLPPYAPELNPDEWLWAYLKKKDLPNFCPQDLKELKIQVRKAVKRIRKRPKLIQSFFQDCPLPF